MADPTKTVVQAIVYKEPVGSGFVLKIDPIDHSKPQHIFSIWFPQAGVFVTPLIAVMHKGAIEATVREDVRDRVAPLPPLPPEEVLVYEYCIYDHTEQEFVTCSPRPTLPAGTNPGPARSVGMPRGFLSKRSAIIDTTLFL